MPKPTLPVARPAMHLGAALLVAAAGLLLPLPALAQPAAPAAAAAKRADQPTTTPAAAMLRFPGVSKSHIVFSYANQLWLVSRDGGLAQPVASPPGPTAFPRFSPDGQTIAFVGNYQGNRDLYTVPIQGGVPVRVTYHPANESLCGWTPDGKLLFLTNAWAPLARQTQLFTVDPAGGLPQRLPMAYAGFGSISPDGKSVVFTPHSIDTRTWKRYRGGMATDLWVMNLDTKESRQLTDWEGTDTLPMWGPDADTVYYLSDNGPEHRLNIWSVNVKTAKRTQVTTFADDDVKWPSMGPGPAGKGEIVFQLGSRLMLLDLATRQSRGVSVTIPGARPTLTTQTEEVGDRVASASISPTGKRVAAEARGELFSVPAKEGVPRNLTRSSAVFERDPSWSPDGRWIAYFSDESGEYELWVRPSDARAADKDDKADDTKKAGDKKPDADSADDASPHADAAKPKPRPGPVKLTTLGPGFRYAPTWSPDSKQIAFTDNAGTLRLATLTLADDGTPSAELKTIDTDSWGNRPQLSWSHDSAHLAYTLSDEGTQQRALWLYSVKADQKHQLTSAMFSVSGVAFDRKGDFLYYISGRNWNSPIYGDNDTTFVYAGTEIIHAVPLRADVKHPFAARSDEEELKPAKKDTKPEHKKDEGKKDEAKKDESKKDEPKKDDTKPADAAKADDGVSGTWEGTASAVPNAPAPIPVTLRLRVRDGQITGSLSTAMGSTPISGTFDSAAKQLTLAGTLAGTPFTITLNLKGEDATGTWAAHDTAGQATLKRTSAEPPAEGKDDAKTDDADPKSSKDKDAKPLVIDFDGFEARAIPLPIPAGNFGAIAVADGDKLVYVREPARGAGGQENPARVYIFDPKDDQREEKVVTQAGNFQISADGKKLLLARSGGLSIVDAAAGGGKTQSVSLVGMRTTVNPREEWKQIFTDAWRLNRDFFYEPGMHNVDWPKLREHYGAMIDDCVSREDVNYVISELISELNIGHAYLQAPGDVAPQPSVSVGMIGADFKLVSTPEGAAYQITRIYEGAPWDSDARGPLSQPGPDKSRVQVGDFLLAVNGTPVDPAKDPYAAFVGLADRTISLTVSKKPVLDGSERDVVVKALASEVGLRYRDWVERNRAHVDKLSNGQVGYIYVPNTGIDGQSELFRQFFGQRDKAALIIDDRWNGGGQIPTRFIELLNRPVTNYWARRHGKDWVWPPDGHQGPKAMLINGLAGSGGDMFPWLFRHNSLGKLIGTRTWGGLVGISGNPSFIDGGNITVPTFGFYKTDGTWGVEGHGVDPDMPVIDNPSALAAGEDPQLDAAVQHLLGEIKTKGYTPPKRPAGPDRRGMGIPERDR